jgi:hypothetical protein
MAVTHLRRKLQTYESLYRLNQHFAAIVHHCRIVEECGFVPAEKMRVHRSFVREVQSLINHDLADHMHTVEDRDAFKFGKARIEREREYAMEPEENPALGENSKPE